MPYLLTRQAHIKCRHETGGRVSQAVTQKLVWIDLAEVLVRSNTMSRPVKGCIAIPPMKPCLVTLAETAGWSDFVFVDGKPVLQDNIDGRTSGDPPGTVHYFAANAGQSLVQTP